MPLVHIEMFPRKDQKIKESLAEDITNAVVKNVGCEKKSVTIVFNEIPKENWVVGGNFLSDLYKDID